MDLLEQLKTEQEVKTAEESPLAPSSDTSNKSMVPGEAVAGADAALGIATPCRDATPVTTLPPSQEGMHYWWDMPQLNHALRGLQRPLKSQPVSLPLCALLRHAQL